tara:strand:+ start:118 stop:315 length:198 start_codon:yes stop_codon:yes gene_type:complete
MTLELEEIEDPIFRLEVKESEFFISLNLLDSLYLIEPRVVLKCQFKPKSNMSDSNLNSLKSGDIS